MMPLCIQEEVSLTNQCLYYMQKKWRGKMFMLKKLYNQQKAIISLVDEIVFFMDWYKAYRNKFIFSNMQTLETDLHISVWKKMPYSVAGKKCTLKIYSNLLQKNLSGADV